MNLNKCNESDKECVNNLMESVMGLKKVIAEKDVSCCCILFFNLNIFELMFAPKPFGFSRELTSSALSDYN